MAIEIRRGIMGIEKHCEGEGETIWKQLLDEAAPLPDVQTFMYRGEIYKLPQAQSDGRAQVVTFDGQSVLWMGWLAGSLTDADKRLASKLKERRFLQHQSRLSPSTEHVVDDPETNDIGVRWEQLLKRKGFDDSFQNSILERVQTPRTHSQSNKLHVPEMPAWNREETWPKPNRDSSIGDSSMSPRTGWEKGGVSANVEEVPAHLRERAVGSMLDVSSNSSFNGKFDSINTSANSGCEMSALRGLAYTTAADAPNTNLLIISNFVSSQGVELKARSKVSLIRHGTRDWVLVRDTRGLKSWVPRSYLQVIPTPAMLAGNEKISQQPSILESKQNETFESDVSEGVRKILHKVHFKADDRSPFTTASANDGPQQQHEGQSSSHGSMSQEIVLKTLLALRGIDRLDALVTSLEQTMGRLVSAAHSQAFNLHVKEENAKMERETLEQWINQIKGLANMDMIAKLEQEIFKERETHDKERHTWTVQKRQLELALQRNGTNTQVDWHQERRKLLLELEAERERANWIEQRLISIQARSIPTVLPTDEQPEPTQQAPVARGEAPGYGESNMNQEVQSIVQKLEKENSAMRQKLQALQEELAERDVALATMAVEKLSCLALDNKQMDIIEQDVVKLGQALAKTMKNRDDMQRVLDPERKGGNLQALAVEHATLKQHVQEQGQKLQRAEKEIEDLRLLAASRATSQASAVLQNKFVPVQRQYALQTTKLEHLQQLQQQIPARADAAASSNASAGRSPEEVKSLSMIKHLEGSVTGDASRTKTSVTSTETAESLRSRRSTGSLLKSSSSTIPIAPLLGFSV
jgi:hypothetical protein